MKNWNILTNMCYWTIKAINLKKKINALIMEKTQVNYLYYNTLLKFAH